MNEQDTLRIGGFDGDEAGIVRWQSIRGDYFYRAFGKAVGNIEALKISRWRGLPPAP